MDEMHKVVLDYVIDEYLEDDEADEIDVDSPLISAGIVDSFSMVSLKLFLENEYQIRIPDELATPEAFDTVRSICELVNRIRQEEASHGLQ
jgi:acyl carrier protein